MKTKIDIKNIRDEVIFSFEKEDNTLKYTVEEAVRQGVSLKDANLCEVDLSCADLSGSNLFGADLSGTDLSGANLFLSCLVWSNLKGAKLRDAKLSNASLYGADLKGTNLKWVNLRGALLYYADLKDADFEGADIYGAYMIGAKNVPNLPLACPSEGEFIAWKKITSYKEEHDGNFLVKLLIPKDAKRCSATTEKCRCSKAKVLDITNIETGEHVDVITNINVTECVYRVGEMVYPDSFDENRWDECSHGIHFFIDKRSAINL